MHSMHLLVRVVIGESVPIKQLNLVNNRFYTGVKVTEAGRRVSNGSGTNVRNYQYKVSKRVYI